MLKGSCACGDVTFTVSGVPRGASVCHCTTCRKMAGFAWSSAYVSKAEIKILGPVVWFEASAAARRGLCPRCGAFLFWTARDEDTLSFALGAVDGPTGLHLEKHIFVGEKGDYYALTDGLPQKG